MTQLHINMIRCDGGTQMRAALNEDAVESYAERMEAGDVFPAVVVYYDGAAHWLADGFHRVAAAQKVANAHLATGDHTKWSRIDADVRAGERQDAIRYAISANKTNGIRRTKADKQMAVRAALAHPAMKGMSDKAIADEAGVSKWMVQDHRKLVINTTSDETSDTKSESATISRKGVDGKTYRRKASAPKVGRPTTKTASRERESKNPGGAAQRAAVNQKQKHICPRCNGEGYIYE